MTDRLTHYATDPPGADRHSGARRLGGDVTSVGGPRSGDADGDQSGKEEIVDGEQNPQFPLNSALPGLYRLSLADRRARIAELAGLTDADLKALSGEGGLSPEQADRMIENAVGVMSLPIGVCANLRVNARDVLVPMVTEEPSVIAAASHAAKLLRSGDGVKVMVSAAHMIGQIQILDVAHAAVAEVAIRGARAELLASANAGHPHLVRAGGGAVDLEVHHLPPLMHDDPVGPMLVVHVIVDVREAMGANAINAMCERLGPRLEELTGGRVRLRILSNLADRRTVTACGRVPLSALERPGQAAGLEVARAIEEASVFAERDPYRAATHNKGIMNGIDAVLLAFAQDWRAVEAGAHAFATRRGRYCALTRWRVAGDELVGRLKIPMAVGFVGGAVRSHPTAKLACRLARISNAAELAEITAAVGLAQNLGALRALACEGIHQGHMRLHARKLAGEAGAEDDEVDAVARHIAVERTVNLDAARVALRAFRDNRRNAGIQ